MLKPVKPKDKEHQTLIMASSSPSVLTIDPTFYHHKMCFFRIPISIPTPELWVNYDWLVVSTLPL